VRVSQENQLTSTISETDRHATNIELFLDLVFVFAVAQIVTVLAADPTPAGFGRGLLLAWLVWWLWSQFAWLGTAIDLGRSSRNQISVLVAVPLTLLMAIAIPNAYEGSGLQFAAAYLVVNLWCLAIQGQAVWSDPLTRTAWLQYAPIASVAPLLLLAGALLNGSARVIGWCGVAAITIASALAASRNNEEGKTAWSVNAAHFAERHALFVIISLGEVMVAIGVAASLAAAGVDVVIGLGVLATAALACSLWWAYFAFVPRAVEHALAIAPDHERGRVARDLFTFGHFPIVFGILLYALTAKHVVIDPTHQLGAPDLFALAAGVALFAGGLTVLRWRIIRSVGPERPVAIVVVAALCAGVGPRVPGTVIVALVALVIVIMQSVTLWRIQARTSRR